MINQKLVCKILGQLLFLEAVFMLCSLGIACVYREDDEFAFLVSILATIGGGLILKWKGHKADNSMSRRDAYLVVSLAWVVFSLFGTLPFLVSGYLHSFTDAYFETMRDSPPPAPPSSTMWRHCPTDCSSGAPSHSG